ncbi:ankyrin repeat domain-containing protein [Intrasporangium mesophilum]
MTEPIDPSTYLKAAEAGDLQLVKAELQSGAPIDATNRQRQSAILLAAKGRHFDVVRHLVAAGADIDQQDETCFNPFIHGCIHNDLELVRIMVGAGTDLTRLTRFGGNGLTPAAEKGHLEIVRELLTTTDINVNLTNFVGWTALIEAIILRDGGSVQQEIVRLLLEHGANPHLTDKWGVAPIELAREKGYAEIVDILVQYGA